MFVTCHDDIACIEPSTTGHRDQGGDRRDSGQKHTATTNDVRQLLKTTILSLSSMAMMLGNRGKSAPITGKALLFYSTTVLVFLVSTFGWNLAMELEMDLLLNIQVYIWTVQTFGHFLIFYTDSIRANGTYKFLDTWQVYRQKYSCGPGSLKCKSNVCAGMIWLLVVLGTFLTWREDLVRGIGANMPTYMYLVITLLPYVYHLSACVSSSIFMLLVSELLADEYQQIYKEIPDMSEGDLCPYTLRIGHVRRRHWELSQLVRKADGIFCAHMGLSVVASLAMSCLTLYNIIWNRAIYDNSTQVGTNIVWFVLALAKLTSDCVAGIILNDAVCARYVYTQCTWTHTTYTHIN